MDLATYLASKGLTEAQFADRVGIGRPTINRIKRGIMQPSVELAIRIEQATGCAVRAETLSDAVALVRRSSCHPHHAPEDISCR